MSREKGAATLVAEKDRDYATASKGILSDKVASPMWEKV